MKHNMLQAKTLRNGICAMAIIATATLGQTAHAQQKVNDGTVPVTAINPSAIAEYQTNNKGLLQPRVALTATNAAAPLAAHVAGMRVYNTATAGTAPNNVTPGEYYNDGTKWVRVATAEGFSNTPYTPTGTFACPFNGSVSGTGFATGLTLTIPSAGWYSISAGFTIHSTCNDYWMYVNTTSGAQELWRVYCGVSNGTTVEYMTPRDQNRMIYLTAGTYPILAGKTIGSVVPTLCGSANPSLYIRAVKIQNGQ
jgi:hypothetical protein